MLEEVELGAHSWGAPKQKGALQPAGCCHDPMEKCSLQDPTARRSHEPMSGLGAGAVADYLLQTGWVQPPFVGNGQRLPCFPSVAAFCPH